MTKERKEKILKTLNRFRVISTDDPINDCFGWKTKISYPRMHVDGIGVVGAHRAAWMAENGKQPANRYIHRTCKNVMCTNPAHLFISSKKVKKFRSPEKIKRRPGRERLSLDLPANLVQNIRKMASKYNMTMTKYLYKRLTEVLKHENKLD